MTYIVSLFCAFVITRPFAAMTMALLVRDKRKPIAPKVNEDVNELKIDINLINKETDCLKDQNSIKTIDNNNNNNQNVINLNEINNLINKNIII